MRRSELLAVKQEVGRRAELWRDTAGERWQAEAELLQLAQPVLSPCAPLIPFTSNTFEITQTRSLVIIPAHTIMLHVLTDVCSSRAHRMWSDLNVSSSECGRALQDAASHRP